MIKRLTILTLMILTGLTVVAVLAHLSLSHWQQGLAGQRLGQFAEVAEQIRSDVNRKLDEFLAQEQNRPYTDYLPVHVPASNNYANEQNLIVRSPLVGQLNQDLAYGYFQIQDDGTILTPNDDIISQFGLNADNVNIQTENTQLHSMLRQDLLPILQFQQSQSKPNRQPTPASKTAPPEQTKLALKQKPQGKIASPRSRANTKSLPIQAFQQQLESQTIQQQRSIVNTNFVNNALEEESRKSDIRDTIQARMQSLSQQPQNAQQEDTITIQVHPFTPIIIPKPHGESLLFGGRVYLVRHIKIEQEHFIQGFSLNQERLRRMVEQSSQQFMRDGMGFVLASNQDIDTAFSAVLDFGFGDLLLDLIELNPGWITRKALWLRRWYFGALGIVGLAVCLGLFSLWQGTRQQIALARQKDDFISAVSHELRTPLTSIRMYAEMLEKGWVKTDDKQSQYHGNIRQESERLSRLIENVLDFSRLQRGRKTFQFELGALNECVTQVAQMMTPYANQQGFSLQCECGELPPCRFDKDAIIQIVVNLVDNAVKYARQAADKTIILRTTQDKHFFVVEVEDHGPGVPYSQRKNIFQEFYRTEAEATRETTGTGLGLALVKRFAEAHQGFVQIMQADPQGALFRVGLKDLPDLG